MKEFQLNRRGYELVNYSHLCVCECVVDKKFQKEKTNIESKR